MEDLGQISRDQARNIWAASGLTNAHLTHDNLRDLRGRIDRAMRHSGLMQGSYRAAQRFRLHLDAPKPWADLRCRSHYFDDRQAVTFEPGGFIGFAGWADEFNVQPILSPFCKWVAFVSTGRALAALAQAGAGAMKDAAAAGQAMQQPEGM